MFSPEDVEARFEQRVRELEQRLEQLEDRILGGRVYGAHVGDGLESRVGRLEAAARDTQDAAYDFDGSPM